MIPGGPEEMMTVSMLGRTKPAGRAAIFGAQGLYLPTNVRVIYRLYISDDAFSILFLFKFEFIVLKLN